MQLVRTFHGHEPSWTQSSIAPRRVAGIGISYACALLPDGDVDTHRAGGSFGHALKGQMQRRDAITRKFEGQVDPLDEPHGADTASGEEAPVTFAPPNPACLPRCRQQCGDFIPSRLQRWGTECATLRPVEL